MPQLKLLLLGDIEGILKIFRVFLTNCSLSTNWYNQITYYLGFICAGHCLDLALQNPLKVKAGPSTFSAGKFAAQIGVAVLAIVVAGFFTLQYQPQIPDALSEHEKNLFNLKAQNYTLDLSVMNLLEYVVAIG